MDMQESLLTAIYETLTEDATLQTLMGGTVSLYPVWAPPDASFPYLVHRLDIRIRADYSPQAACTYILDIWSDSPNTIEVLDIHERILALLDGLDSSTSETSDFNMWSQTHGFVPETEEHIWHYTSQFNLVFLKDAQVGVLLKRM